MSFSDTVENLRRSSQKVLVVGLGISGVESARFLSRRGLQVLVAERQTAEVFAQKSKFLADVEKLRGEGIGIHFGVDGEAVAPILNGVGLAVLSPGVPLESAIVGTITRHGIPYVSELELGIELHGGRSIVVTGSNGKSTTVSLIDHIMKHAGIKSYLCGNVGTPVISNAELLSELRGERSTLVVEASSYQLEACTVLKPAVSIVLNVSENHLERHGTLERYAAAKARVFRLQDQGDLAIANADDPVVRAMARASRASLAFFGECEERTLQSLAETWAHISYAANSAVIIRVQMQCEREEYGMEAVSLLGPHNRFNMAAAILATRRLGVPKRTVQEALESFTPLEHRLEVCVRDVTRTVINDSKSTTVAASVAALATVSQAFPNQPVTLMLGGLSKAGSWKPLLDEVRENRGRMLSVVCFGKDGPLLGSHCRAAGIEHVVVPSLKDAAEQGLKLTSAGGVVLLSPGCASFDEFSDFEHRGREFKRYIAEFLGGSV
jgi:UDP-N-acetylmuramoylalanine--D-glutamate ligase